jgi:hypothetical protein
MRSLALLVVAGIAHAGPVPMSIENSALWPSHPKPVSIRIDGGAWQKVGTGKKIGAAPIKVPTGGKAITIDVQAPSGAKSFRRIGVVLPDHVYKIVGNPCGTWGLDVDARDDGNESTIQVDASALPAKRLVIVVEAGEIELAAPGTSLPLGMPVSAMCPRSGAPLRIKSVAEKRDLFDASVILHPGALHTLRFTKNGTFTITVAR